MFQASLFVKNPIFTSDVVGRLSALAGSGGVYAVISKKIAFLYRDLAKELKKAGCRIIPFEDGEKAKSYGRKIKLETLLLEAGANKRSTIAAVGGGTLIDLAGFTASTLFRGVGWVIVPTTLLAMVDASIGGKTAINAKQGKNLIGSFHFPKEILIWLPFLQTLPAKEMRNGLAECLKHGLIADETYFHKVLAGGFDSEAEAKSLVGISQKIKLAVVRKDPFDKNGERNLLNFGHTVGHALEKAGGYRIPHGKAVAFGMLWEIAASRLDGFCDAVTLETSRKSIFNLFDSKDLLKTALDDVWKAVQVDKKRGERTVNFVPLKSIGSPALSKPYLHPLDFELLKKSYNLLMKG